MIQRHRPLTLTARMVAFVTPSSEVTRTETAVEGVALPATSTVSGYVLYRTDFSTRAQGRFKDTLDTPRTLAAGNWSLTVAVDGAPIHAERVTITSR